MNIIEMKVTDLIPYSKNAKKHPQEQIDLIKNSIKEFGFKQPLVIDTDNTVVIGHGRLEACKQTDRTCYTMELDPKYVDVIIKRYENLTGNKAVLLNGTASHFRTQPKFLKADFTTLKEKEYFHKSEVRAITAKEELNLINTFSRKELMEDDVFTFNVTLCDNDIDRDFECFSEESLKNLKDLFVGKTGISDHSMRSKDQAFRVFHTYLEKDEIRKTAYGKDYVALKAKAYTVRTENNASLIAEIDGGIKKEVSISCSAEKCICSICRKDMNTRECKHIKGRSYGGKLCYGILENPTDAYEWSFVAVPAQRKA